jgi:hypothetical protein
VTKFSAFLESRHVEGRALDIHALIDTKDLPPRLSQDYAEHVDRPDRKAPTQSACMRHNPKLGIMRLMPISA